MQTGLDAAAERGDYDRVERLNFEFHPTIYRMARAPKISWLLCAKVRYVPREFCAAVMTMGKREPLASHYRLSSDLDQGCWMSCSTAWPDSP